MKHHQYYAPYIKEFARALRKNQTEEEKKFWQIVRNSKLGVKFRRQFQIDNKYIADFVCLEKHLIIEIDGGQHNDNFYDVQRTFYLKNLDFKIIRFLNNEINQNIDGCVQYLKEIISSPLAGEDVRLRGKNEYCLH